MEVRRRFRPVLAAARNAVATLPHDVRRATQNLFRSAPPDPLWNLRVWWAKAIAVQLILILPGFVLPSLPPFSSEGIGTIVVYLLYIYSIVIYWNNYCHRHGPFNGARQPMVAPRRWIYEAALGGLMLTLVQSSASNPLWAYREAAGGKFASYKNATGLLHPQDVFGGITRVSMPLSFPDLRQRFPAELSGEWMAPVGDNGIFALGASLEAEYWSQGGIILELDQEGCADRAGLADALCVRWLDYASWSETVLRNWYILCTSCALVVIFLFPLVVDTLNVFMFIIIALAFIITMGWVLAVRGLKGLRVALTRCCSRTRSPRSVVTLPTVTPVAAAAAAPAPAPASASAPVPAPAPPPDPQV